MDVQKAIRFIEENGTEMDRYRLNYLLTQERNDVVPLSYLRGLQNEDGGFPYNNKKGNLSCINVTSLNLSLMIELGLTASDNCRRTLEYLLRVQGKDGSWDQAPAISQYNPPFWNTPGDLKVKMWLTACTLNNLLKLGYRESEAVRKATQFLLKHQDEDGKFVGFLQATWISVGIFGQLEGSNSENVKKALIVIERNSEQLENDPPNLTWCLECFYVAGISKDDPVVKRCIDQVIKLQRQDGAWSSGDGAERTVSTTLGALKTLKMYKIW